MLPVGLKTTPVEVPVLVPVEVPVLVPVLVLVATPPLASFFGFRSRTLMFLVPFFCLILFLSIYLGYLLFVLC